MNYDYRRDKLAKDLHYKIKEESNNIFSTISDYEIRTLILCSFVGPLCALAYIVWTKYPRLKWLSVVAFIINIGFLASQIGGLLYIGKLLYGLL